MTFKAFWKAKLVHSLSLNATLSPIMMTAAGWLKNCEGGFKQTNKNLPGMSLHFLAASAELLIIWISSSLNIWPNDNVIWQQRTNTVQYDAIFNQQVQFTKCVIVLNVDKFVFFFNPGVYDALRWSMLKIFFLLKGVLNATWKKTHFYHVTNGAFICMRRWWITAMWMLYNLLFIWLRNRLW
jgi:hypothetical protein